MGMAFVQIPSAAALALNSSSMKFVLASCTVNSGG